MRPMVLTLGCGAVNVVFRSAKDDKASAISREATGFRRKEKKRTRRSDATSPLLKHHLHIAHARHDDAAGVTIHAAGFGAFSTGG